jgi:tRNA(Arg) A34 adenosine deaminase TadA
MSQIHFVKRSVDLAVEKMLEGQGGPFGAVIVKDGKIIAEGFNRVTSTLDPTAHAEVVAIRNACEILKNFELKGCEIYSSCEPCPMCLGAIYWARLDKLYFASSREDAAKAGFDDSFIYKEVPLPLSQRAIPTSQIFVAEGARAFEAWAKNSQKILY